MTKLQLSSKGRQEFGTWLANRLVIAGGGTVALVLVPALLGKMPLPASFIAGGWVVVAALAASAGLIKYLTEERAGEDSGELETTDV